MHFSSDFLLCVHYVKDHIHTQKAQTSCCLLTNRGLRITFRVNKQQETYADMTNLLPKYSKERYIVIPDRHLLVTLI